MGGGSTTLSPDVASLWQNFLDSIPAGVGDVPMSQLPKYNSPLSLPVRVGSSTEKESTDESNDNSMVIEQAPILRFGRLPSEVRALQSAVAPAPASAPRPSATPPSLSAPAPTPAPSVPVPSVGVAATPARCAPVLSEKMAGVISRKFCVGARVSCPAQEFSADWGVAYYEVGYVKFRAPGTIEAEGEPPAGDSSDKDKPAVSKKAKRNKFWVVRFDADHALMTLRQRRLRLV